MTQRRTPEPASQGVFDEATTSKPVAGGPATDGYYHLIKNETVGGNLSGVYLLSTGFTPFIENTYGGSDGGGPTNGVIGGETYVSDAAGHITPDEVSVLVSAPSQTTTMRYDVALNIQSPIISYNDANLQTSGTTTLTTGEFFSTQVGPDRRVQLRNRNSADDISEIPVLPKYSPTVTARARLEVSTSFNFTTVQYEVRFARPNVIDTVYSY